MYVRNNHSHCSCIPDMENSSYLIRPEENDVIGMSDLVYIRQTLWTEIAHLPIYPQGMVDISTEVSSDRPLIHGGLSLMREP